MSLSFLDSLRGQKLSNRISNLLSLLLPTSCSEMQRLCPTPQFSSQTRAILAFLHTNSIHSLCILSRNLQHLLHINSLNIGNPLRSPRNHPTPTDIQPRTLPT